MSDEQGRASMGLSTPAGTKEGRFYVPQMRSNGKCKEVVARFGVDARNIGQRSFSLSELVASGECAGSMDLRTFYANTPLGVKSGGRAGWDNLRHRRF